MVAITSLTLANLSFSHLPICPSTNAIQPNRCLRTIAFTTSCYFLRPITINNVQQKALFSILESMDFIYFLVWIRKWMGHITFAISFNNNNWTPWLWRKPFKCKTWLCLHLCFSKRPNFYITRWFSDCFLSLLNFHLWLRCAINHHRLVSKAWGTFFSLQSHLHYLISTYLEKWHGDFKATTLMTQIQICLTVAKESFPPKIGGWWHGTRWV